MTDQINQKPQLDWARAALAVTAFIGSAAAAYKATESFVASAFIAIVATSLVVGIASLGRGKPSSVIPDGITREDIERLGPNAPESWRTAKLPDEKPGF